MSSNVAKRKKEARERERDDKRARRRAERSARRAAGGGLLPREVQRRALYTRMLIVCEGARTEPNYFQNFPVRNGCVIQVEGTGMNTASLVREALRLRKDQAFDDPGDEVWVVFDRDSFPVKNFNDALNLASREGLKVAWSNEAFELWYLLHFEFCDAALSRDTYRARLSRYLKRPYLKNDPSMYQALLERQDEAIRNAMRLRSNRTEPPVDANPSTEVDRLVVRLNALRRR